jgi:hypothetical protein
MITFVDSTFLLCNIRQELQRQYGFWVSGSVAYCSCPLIFFSAKNELNSLWGRVFDLVYRRRDWSRAGRDGGGINIRGLNDIRPPFPQEYRSHKLAFRQTFSALSA